MTSSLQVPVNESLQEEWLPGLNIWLELCYSVILRPIVAHIFVIHHSLCYRYTICCMAGHNGMKEHLQSVMCIRPMSHSRAWCHLISLPMTPAKACLKSYCLQPESRRETTQVKVAQTIITKLFWFSSYLLLFVSLSFSSFTLYIPVGHNFLKSCLQALISGTFLSREQIFWLLP